MFVVYGRQLRLKLNDLETDQIMNDPIMKTDMIFTFNKNVKKTNEHFESTH